jgi:uncharacterized protein involved in exopolysaccharide biosynthesis
VCLLQKIQIREDQNPMTANTSPTYDDEIKIDFGKYIETLVRQWQWIAACALGLGILALAFSLFIKLTSPPSYEAVALVSSAKTESSVNFGSAITSSSDIALAAATGNAQILYDRAARLQSFVSLVQNGAVAEQVLAEVGPKLNNSNGEPITTTALLHMVSAELIPKTDTIQISVTYDDPVIAAEIANAWGNAYVQRINELYGGASSGTSMLITEAQTTQAKTDYEKAQAALSDFIAHNKIDEYTRQIQEITVIVTSLRGARSTATSTIINEQVGVEQQVINELYSAQAANQLLALQQDQAARRQLITAYMTALSQARQAVFNQQVQDRLAQFDRAYSDSRQVGLFLDNAVSMRAAVNAGGDAAARSNTLALTMLKTQIYAAFPGTNTLQIQNLPEALGSSISTVNAAGMVADLDALISTLETRQTELNKLIDTLSSELQNGEDFKFLDNPLDSTGALAQTIQDRYPELFERGKLSDLSLTVVENGNPLATEALQRSQALLELKGLEGVVNFSVADTPIEKKIQENEQKIRDLNSLISSETSTLNLLAGERDLAWKTYTTLTTKSAEQSVATQTTGIEVVFGSPATPPDEKVVVHSTTNAAMATGVGLLIGIIVAYAYEFWQNYKGRQPEIISRKMFAYAKSFADKMPIKPKRSTKARPKRVASRSSR